MIKSSLRLLKEAEENGENIWKPLGLIFAGLWVEAILNPMDWKI